jgi:arylsulfatase A-like enzyme
MCGAVVLCAGRLDAATRQNVLFIAVDDLNDWIGVLNGHPQSRTPNIDRLASRGMLFCNAHCAAPACNPSRAALMTGRRPSTSGVYHNPDPWRKAMPKATTIAQHFQANGYVAIGSGKIFHGAFPDPPSWDIYFPSKTKTRPGDPLPDDRPINGIPKTAHFDWGPLDVTDAEMGDAQVVSWVIEQLQNEHDKPFFLACGLFRPHLPWYVPQKYFDAFPLSDIQLPKTNADDLNDVPPAAIKMARPRGDHAKVLQHHQWHAAVQGYLASIKFADVQIGRLLNALDESKYAKNTIIVFWTDHGWHLGEKQHWRKFALWEEATRTPVIIVAPGVVPGSRCTRPINLIDIYPTLIELCKLTDRDDLDGTSFHPLLVDPTITWERPSLTTHGRNNHALRSDHFRYIRYADGSEELYDHRLDPQEWTNLAADAAYADVIQRMSAWIPKQNAPRMARREPAKRSK